MAENLLFSGDWALVDGCMGRITSTDTHTHARDNEAERERESRRRQGGSSTGDANRGERSARVMGSGTMDSGM